MRSTRLETAILLFSRSAAVEAVAKPLAFHGKGTKRAIAGYLIQHAQRVAKRTGLPVYFIAENQQQGASFGDRITNAFEQLFSRGFERVISIGNDCPTLSTNDIQYAVQKLDTTGAVFGPAKDGGVYLIGMRKDAFNAVNFASLRWQTGQTLSDLKAYATEGFCCLSEKYDLDSAEDLEQQLLGRSLPVRLRIRLLNILKPRLPGWSERRIFSPDSVQISGPALRGPPCFVAPQGP